MLTAAFVLALQAELPVLPLGNRTNHQNTPAFVDQRSQQAMNLERAHQQRNIANEQQGLYPNQAQAPQFNQQPAYMQQMNQIEAVATDTSTASSRLIKKTITF